MDYSDDHNYAEGVRSPISFDQAWSELERAAETIDDEIEALEDATAPTLKLLRWETTV